MSMTGKYKGTEDAVTISAELETAILARIHLNGAYDTTADVEFCSCSDGCLIDIPVTSGKKTRHVISFNLTVLQHLQPWMADLKAIYDGQTPIGDSRSKKCQEIMDAAIVDPA